MSTAEKSVYTVLIAIAALATVALTIRLVTLKSTGAKVAGILLLILLILWMGQSRGEAAIVGGIDYIGAKLSRWIGGKTA